MVAEGGPGSFCMAPLMVVTGLFYSSYHHFGVTNLRQNFIGNQITLESLVYGLTLGDSGWGGAVDESSVYAVFFHRQGDLSFWDGSVPGSPSSCRGCCWLVPEMGAQARSSMARRGDWQGGLRQGHMSRRWKNGLQMLSMLVTWTVETLAAASDSMKPGRGRKGRTAFSIYRFDNRDRAFVVGLFACLTVVWMGAALGQTGMRCNPRIILNPVTPLSWGVFGAYARCACCPGLEVWTEHRFRRARTKCCQIPGSAHDVWRRFYETDHSERSAGDCAFVVAISAFRLWEIGRSYRKANQVYRQTADRFVQQAPADTQPVQPHGGEDPAGAHFCGF